MALAKVLRGIIFFTAVVSFAAVSADWEENLESDEEFGLMNNTVEVEENDNAVDIQDG